MHKMKTDDKVNSPKRKSQEELDNERVKISKQDNGNKKGKNGTTHNEYSDPEIGNWADSVDAELRDKNNNGKKGTKLPTARNYLSPKPREHAGEALADNNVNNLQNLVSTYLTLLLQIKIKTEPLGKKPAQSKRSRRSDQNNNKAQTAPPVLPPSTVPVTTSPTPVQDPMEMDEDLLLNIFDDEPYHYILTPPQEAALLDPQQETPQQLQQNNTQTQDSLVNMSTKNGTQEGKHFFHMIRYLKLVLHATFPLIYTIRYFKLILHVTILEPEPAAAAEQYKEHREEPQITYTHDQAADNGNGQQEQIANQTQPATQANNDALGGTTQQTPAGASNVLPPNNHMQQIPPQVRFPPPAPQPYYEKVVILPTAYPNRAITSEGRAAISTKLTRLSILHQERHRTNVTPRSGEHTSGTIVIEIDSRACSTWLHTVVRAPRMWTDTVPYTLGILQYDENIFAPTYTVWNPDATHSFDDVRSNIERAKNIDTNDWRFIKKIRERKTTEGCKYLFLATQLDQHLGNNQSITFSVGFNPRPGRITVTSEARYRPGRNRSARNEHDQQELELEIINAAQANILNLHQHEEEMRQDEY